MGARLVQTGRTALTGAVGAGLGGATYESVQQVASSDAKHGINLSGILEAGVKSAVFGAVLNVVGQRIMRTSWMQRGAENDPKVMSLPLKERIEADLLKKTLATDVYDAFKNLPRAEQIKLALARTFNLRDFGQIIMGSKESPATLSTGPTAAGRQFFSGFFTGGALIGPAVQPKRDDRD